MRCSCVVLVALRRWKYTNKDITVKLSISDQTVKNHLTSIFDKMRVFSRLELVLCATENKLFDEAV